MCGFVGFTGLREGREAILHKMADRIIHRGPDMEGYHLSGETPADAVAPSPVVRTATMPFISAVSFW